MDDELALGRELEVVAAAERPAWPVGVEGCDVAGGAAAGRLYENVGALAFLPLGPVACEEVVDDARFGAFLVLLRSLLVASVVALALRVDLAGEGDPAAVGREDAVVGAGRKRRDLAGIAAIEAVEPELAFAGDEEVFAVGRPAGVLGAAVAGELFCLAGLQGEKPDVLHVAVAHRREQRRILERFKEV